MIVGSARGSCRFFFFQAEDGIRDDLVTGVQTCALPISGKPHFGVRPLYQTARVGAFTYTVGVPQNGAYLVNLKFVEFLRGAGRRVFDEIGRASCRESVLCLGVEGACKRKE